MEKKGGIMMRGHVISAVYVLNIIMQSIFSLLFSTAIFVGIGYLLTAYLEWDAWVYIPLIIAGLATGILSMVKLIITSMSNLERLERGRAERNGVK